jgi:hypothetical protein
LVGGRAAGWDCSTIPMIASATPPGLAYRLVIASSSAKVISGSTPGEPINPSVILATGSQV